KMNYASLWLILNRASFLCMALLATGAIQGLGATNSPSAAAPIAFTRAADVLERVRENLPNEAIQIRGELLCGSRRGKLDRAFYLDANLQLGQSPATACYTLRDAFGAAAEQLTIVRQPNGGWRRNYAKGRPLQGAPAPSGDSLIGGSDVTWNDLSLAFLWWTDGVITGRELLLERECLVLEFMPPQAPRLTRVWIDEALLVLIKVEEYDAQRVIQRRITVRTFKKIGDNWMIKDLDIRRWPGEHRTLIRLNDVTVITNTAEVISNQ
ncbi:MAG: outer membrane lipoprotein-sorting protein, partial [Kiritimatiellota bacterium]|nr:outer membrane lipoprotein-sorting protein [Kiritimatiellota bacterium]